LTAQLGRPAGRVVVFRPDDERTPPNEYRQATDLTRVMAREGLACGESIQPESVEAMNRYWNRYYGEGADQGSMLQAYRQDAKFATLAQHFEMISDRTLDVFVPFNNAARDAIDELRAIGQLTKDLRRRLQRFVVGLRPYEFEKARGVLEEIRKDCGIWVAVRQAYVFDKGLKLELDISDNIL
jgi:CRISPR-associated endonuclease/helicase Cas3